MLGSITVLMQGIVDLVKVLKRPGYMVLALALFTIGFELLSGGFWLRLFNWILGGTAFHEVLETKLSEDPIQATLGIFFILLSVWVGCYFEYLRLRGRDDQLKRPLKASSVQKRLLKALQHKTFDRQHIDTGLLKTAYQEPINTLNALHIHNMGQWVLHPKSINTTFTELSLLMDHGKDDPEGRFRETAKFSNLNAILNDPELQTHQSFVLLGRPGGGKSTLLKHLQYELSLEALTAKIPAEHPVPFFIRLNEYPPEQDTHIEPNAWLEQRWSQTYPELPSLKEVQKHEGVVFLLDALNEMRCLDTQDYLVKVKRWKQWLTHLTEQRNNCRAVFTCRSLNYSESLSTEALTVPQIQFEDFSDEKIQEYLKHYLPHEGQRLFEQLKHVEGFSEFKTPFYLNLAIEYYQKTQDLSGVTPSSLIASMIWLALERELKKSADKFSLDSLTDKDRKRINYRSWLSAPHKLPDDGFFIPYLIKTAWFMQQGCSGSDSHQVNISEKQLIKRLVSEQLDQQHILTMLDLASDLELIERDMIQETCQFTHQILQEYFAAHEWLQVHQFSMIQQPYLIEEVAMDIDRVIHDLALTDPLPPPPSHGWEQTALHAVVIAHDANSFIQKLSDYDLVLAARCSVQKKSQLASALISSLQERLLHRMQGDQNDLRARISAGHALGHLGDHRFKKSPCDRYIKPPMVRIDCGIYEIDNAHREVNDLDSETVSLPNFSIGQYPVTNAEWQCFIDDEGYNNPEWWVNINQDAELWRQGKYIDQQSFDWHVQRYNEFQTDFEATMLRYRYNEYRASWWLDWIKQPIEEFQDMLTERLKSSVVRKYPREWKNPLFNNPSQPVVGICLFEALAYCQWLSHKMNKKIVLPSEVQWEAAALYIQNDKKQNYPWGDDFKERLANTDIEHIRTTTPVGLFKNGSARTVPGYREGEVYDVIGNVREWTSSLFHPQDDSTEKSTHRQRVTIGGSWRYDGNTKHNRLHYRTYNFSSYGDNDEGLRIVCLE